MGFYSLETLVMWFSQDPLVHTLFSLGAVLLGTSVAAAAVFSPARGSGWIYSVLVASLALMGGGFYISYH